jgi:hypothetical protein
MSTLVKINGVYRSIIGISVKTTGVYSAGQSTVKAGGIYQPTSGPIILPALKFNAVKNSQYLGTL